MQPSWDNPWQTEETSKPQPAEPEPSALTVAKALPPDLLLIVFIHG